MENRWKDTDKKKPKYFEKTLSLSHFFYYKFHMS